MPLRHPTDCRMAYLDSTMDSKSDTTCTLTRQLFEGPQDCGLMRPTQRQGLGCWKIYIVTVAVWPINDPLLLLVCHGPVPAI